MDVGYTSAYRKKAKKQLPEDLVSKQIAWFFIISVIKVSEGNTTSIIVTDNSPWHEITVSKTFSKTEVPILKENKWLTPGG